METGVKVVVGIILVLITAIIILLLMSQWHGGSSNILEEIFKSLGDILSRFSPQKPVT